MTLSRRAIRIIWTKTPGTREATWKRFGLNSQADAETTKSLAYNQGFYNLFLAVGAFIGVGCVAFGAAGSAQHVVGWTLMVSCCGSMLLAAAVLALTGRKYLRAAVLAGPAIASGAN